jgi:hypothetical protein
LELPEHQSPAQSRYDRHFSMIGDEHPYRIDDGRVLRNLSVGWQFCPRIESSGDCWWR